jgi:DNA-binding transcriptional MerR regulator
MKDDVFVMASEAARILGRSPDSVKNYADRGLLPAIKTSRGVRLFLKSDVLALRSQAQKRRKYDGR